MPARAVILIAMAALPFAMAAPATGLASWYGEDHRGRIMANGRPFDPDKLTAASWHYPLGARVTVRAGGRAVRVTITDRGPNHRLRGRIIDLSAAAFRRIEHPRHGLVRVHVERTK